MSKIFKKIRTAGNSHFFPFFFTDKKAILLVLPFKEIGFDQSSPVHPVSESNGGSPERYEGRTKSGNPGV